ncbi:hypothetical protein MNV49_005322 [Pseudohyphozyma bogoriensis]|nr:hypothetical protein MNV49_005322 [Pseudohyphozyma bogoriensis]
MSWARGGPSSSAKAADDAAQSNLEAQNEQHLNELHAKLQSLRGVTTDIYSDSRSQNSLLDGTSNSFDSFRTSLTATSTRFARNVQGNHGQARLQLGIVLGFVGLFFVYKFFHRA